MEQEPIDVTLLETYSILTLAKMLDKATLENDLINTASISIMISKKAMLICNDAMERVVRDLNA